MAAFISAIAKIDRTATVNTMVDFAMKIVRCFFAVAKPHKVLLCIE